MQILHKTSTEGGRPFATRPSPRCGAPRRSPGFTLMEVAVAGFLVALLSACVFRGILTVKQNSQALAQRIAAQGLCVQRYEEMKSVAYEVIDETTFPMTNVLLCSLSKDPTKGRLMAEITNGVTEFIEDSGHLKWKNVDITCRWTFRGRLHTETLHGMIVDEYSTYAEHGSLTTPEPIDLNPNYPKPQMFYIRSTSGEVYTQANIDEMPSSLNATTVVVMPGGGGRQSISLDGSSKSIHNGKTVAFTASSLADPIEVTFSKTTDLIPVEGESGEVVDTLKVTRYSATFSCGNASFSYK